MKNIQKLIDQTFSYAETAPIDLKSMYMEDARDFIVIQNYV